MSFKITTFMLPAAVLAAAMAVTVTLDAQRGQQNAQMRFAAMDTNRDGVISRDHTVTVRVHRCEAHLRILLPALGVERNGYGHGGGQDSRRQHKRSNFERHRFLRCLLCTERTQQPGAAVRWPRAKRLSCFAWLDTCRRCSWRV